VTGNYHRDRILGTLLTNLIGGLSIGWWADVRCVLAACSSLNLLQNHNIHHREPVRLRRELS
jgi:hypothetical protein